MKKKQTKLILPIFILFCLFLPLCGKSSSDIRTQMPSPMPTAMSEPALAASAVPLNVADISAYSDSPYVEINGNVPYFSDDELTTASFEYYSELDSLGRCGAVYACVGRDIMPAEERGEIGQIKPSGWHTVKYNGIVEDNYLYNRCHLIGYQLTGENDNPKNLITGTRYLNISGMCSFENRVGDYVKKTGNHVLYRVVPVFEGDNLLASGVTMEAKSVEDNGEGISFNVYCYNVQPGITIDYANGDSHIDESLLATANPTSQPTIAPEPGLSQTPAEDSRDLNSGKYVVNRKNGKIHINGKCSATGTGDKGMKEPEYFGTYEEAEAFSIQIKPLQDKRKCGNCW